MWKFNALGAAMRTFAIWIAISGLMLIGVANANDVALPDLAKAKEIIMKHCVEEWPDDHNMRLYCIKKQLDALKELKDMD